MISASEAVRLLRERGVKMTVPRLINGIESGYYGFGKVISVGATGRRTVEIYRKQFIKWMEEIT